MEKELLLTLAGVVARRADALEEVTESGDRERAKEVVEALEGYISKYRIELARLEREKTLTKKR